MSSTQGNLMCESKICLYLLYIIVTYKPVPQQFILIKILLIILQIRKCMKIIYKHLFLKQCKYIYFTLTMYLLSANSFESKRKRDKKILAPK